ncbi:hypothetical protein ALC62_15724 [Cyphomyrmex costatus]|uniref:DUF7041 domain-containing protein n=1 Tax=Cyphomyrmex costatus TaxID=456900 RepID=A0A151I6E1_9HYME|nr:hypothetical protein ALC62_15724 [Cyphomyrmex costatus]
MASVSSDPPSDDQASVTSPCSYDEVPALSRVGMRPTPFWKTKPDLCLFISRFMVQMETLFRTAGITVDVTKYYYVIQCLDDISLTEVSGIVVNPSATDKYIALKNQSLKVFAQLASRNAPRITVLAKNCSCREILIKFPEITRTSITHQQTAHGVKHVIETTGPCQPKPISGEFFSSEKMPSDSRIFVEDFRVIMQKLRPKSTSHHIRPKLFFHKDLYNCSHVFLKVEGNRRPLDQPYTGPHKVLERISDKVFAIDVNGRCINVIVDRLKPAYLIIQDSETTPTTASPSSTNIPVQCKPKTYSGLATKRKTISFKI